jgi:hypothetical protein
VLAPGDKLVAISTYYVQHDHGQGYVEPFTRVNERGIRLFTVADDGSNFAPHPDVPFIDFKSLFPHKGAVSGGTLNTWRSGDDGRTVAERLQVRF